MNKSEVRLLLVYKNFQATAGISHIGLGVAALNVMKCLNSIGIFTQVIPIKAEGDLEIALQQNPDTTHVVVSAPWITTPVYSRLCAIKPGVQFAMCSHSNVGFLQADQNGIKLIKEDLALEASTYNFHVAGNSKRFCQWIENAFGEPCAFLPNLYYTHHKHGETKPLWRHTGGTLRLGIFGATRSLKNMMTSVAAGMEMASDLNAHTEICINSERDDGPESRHIRRSVREMLSGLPNVTLKEVGWDSWTNFKKFVGTCHLLLQPSYTESFNMVTADGVSEGVASVVSDAVPWAPRSWVGPVDDASEIARVGVGLLNDPEAARKGLEALKNHNTRGEEAWVSYLCNNNFGGGMW